MAGIHYHVGSFLPNCTADFFGLRTMTRAGYPLSRERPLKQHLLQPAPPATGSLLNSSVSILDSILANWCGYAMHMRLALGVCCWRFDCCTCHSPNLQKSTLSPQQSRQPGAAGVSVRRGI